MVIGEYNWDALQGLQPSVQAFLLLYYIIFSIMAFFILVNFFLAIVVESFVEVKKLLEDQVTENSSLYDFCDIFFTWFFFFRHGLPRRPELIKALADSDANDPDRRRFDHCCKVEGEDNKPGEYYGEVGVSELMALDVHPRISEAQAIKFLRFYYQKVGDLKLQTIEHDDQKLVLMNVGIRMETRAQKVKEINKDKSRGPDPLKDVEQKTDGGNINSLELALTLKDQEIGRLQAKLEHLGPQLMEAQKKVFALRARAS